jgi:hypothetical protein
MFMMDSIRPLSQRDRNKLRKILRAFLSESQADLNLLMDAPTPLDWLPWLERAGSNNESDIREGHRWILDQVHRDSPSALSIAFSIIEADALSPLVRRMASFVASDCLSPRSPAHLAQIRECWKNRPDLAQSVKSSLYTLVLHDDQVIRNQAARCFALVFGLEGPNWPTAISDIADFLGQSSGSPLQAIGLLTVFKEVLALKNFSEPFLESFMPDYRRVWALSLEIMRLPDIDSRVTFAASECVRDGLSAIPNLIESGAQASLLLSSLEHLFCASEARLRTCCHRIMFNLITQYYDNAEEFLPQIWDFTAAGIGQVSRPDQRVTSILFWHEVAEWEHFAFPAFGDKYRGICVKLAPSLLPLLFGIICGLPSDAVDVEEFDARHESGFATLTIGAFFRLDPQLIFEQFIQANFALTIGHESWVMRHAAVLLLYAMSESDGPEEVFDFLAEAMPPLLACCAADEVPRLQDTALFVLAQVLRHYRELFDRSKRCQNPEAAVDQVLSVIQRSPDSHPIILLRCAMVLEYLAALWLSPLAGHLSPLSGRIDDMLDLARGFLGRGIACAADMDLYQTAAEALVCIIGAADRCLHEENLLQLLEAILLELAESRTSIEEDSVKFVVQASLCGAMAAIAQKLGNSLPDGALIDCTDLLFSLFHMKNTLVYGEAVTALTGLHLHLANRFSQEQLIVMLDAIGEGLRSMSPEVINACASLLGAVFRLQNVVLIDSFQPCFEMAGTLLMENPEMRSIHPVLVNAIAQMFLGLVPVPSIAARIEGMRDPFMQLLRSVREVPIDSSNHNDLEYGNRLFEFLANGYFAWICHFYPRDVAEQRAVLIEIAAFAAAVERMRAPSDHLLLNFCRLIGVLVPGCAPKNGAILHRRQIVDVLRRCTSNDRRAEIKSAGVNALSAIQQR